jgi:Xaa-Pro aminopeptidase
MAMSTRSDHRQAKTIEIPFDAEQLDRLLEEANVDLLVVTSKHNIQYLLGGYRFIFFDYMDALGASRYLPILIYRKGKTNDCAYIGHRLEVFEKELGRFWPPLVETKSNSSTHAMEIAVEQIKRLGGPFHRIGIEAPFLPVDAYAVLTHGLANVEIVDASFTLDRLRTCKTPAELELLRESSERVVQSMLAVMKTCEPGVSKAELVDNLRREQVNRGLTFEYCLMTAGTSLNRAISDEQLAEGDILSLDSGGNYRGYIGDLCRMGILGEPDAELEDLLGFVQEVQRRARSIIGPGATGREVFASANQMIEASRHLSYTDFFAHGMGLVSHEGPRLTSTSPLPYAGYDEDRELEANMVISVETTMKHPRRGFIKLEDTVAVTANGNVGFGDDGRSWNRCGKIGDVDTGS